MSENNPKPVETPAEWFRFAKENQAVAEREIAYSQPACHTICFLCQSAAEKYLKGYLIAHGWTLEKTHDIAWLLELCAEYDPAFTELLSEGETLNEYITAGRYPGDLTGESLARDDAVEALRIVRKIQDIIFAHQTATQPITPQ